MFDYAIIIIIFVAVIFLVIFAPKSQNFFNKEDFPFDKLSKNEDLFLDTSIRLNIIESENLDDETLQKLEDIKENVPFNELKWEEWPDKNIISGDVSILPIFSPFGANKINSEIFANLLEFVKHIPVKSIYFIKLEPNSRFVENKGYSLTNDTLRFIYCFNSYCYDVKECGIWVNYESKKTINGDSYIYDSSKTHSLYNNTTDMVIYLVIDFVRPENIPIGYSDFIIQDDISDAFKKMHC
jgi:Aspartyl/Asparaginyl beta-hydroxylase